ncbi:MAG: ABC transporter permease [Deltaproteobacteria bacterium]|nr:ABC transporter permease [Deltaproteobacteria bacterium]
MLRDLRFRLRALFRRSAVERELADELQFHLEQSIAAHVAAGKPRAEAERLARVELGGVEVVKEDCRQARGTRPIEDLATDVRYGLRVLRRAPVFTAVAVITLALGIGINTAMFSLVDASLRQPLPYDAPDELVRLHGHHPQFERGSISFPNFLDWQRGNHTFAAMAISRDGAFTLTGSGAAERVTAALVSSDYFVVLGTAPLLGRAFARGEAEPGGPANVVVGERLWKGKLGGRADVVGRSIVLDGKGYTVIGVMPAGPDLHVIAGGAAPDVYMPIGQIDPDALKRRGAGLGMHGIGRLAPGVTIEQARADIGGVTQRLAQQYPETNRSMGATIDPLREAVFGNTRPYVLLLFAAVALVLLIACVNVANLVLARSAGRSREIAIRLALGASTGRIVRQLLTESVLLGLMGGALGLFVAWWCSDTLFALLPHGLAHVGALRLDGGLLAFTAAISILAGLIAGLTPALRSRRADLHDTLKEGGRGPSTTRYRAQSTFVVCQLAMTFVLLAGAAAVVRTVVHLATDDPGYDRAGVITFGLSLSPALKHAPADRIRAELRRIETALAASPQTSAMSLAGEVPIEADDQVQLVIDGKPPPPNRPSAQRFIVGPGYAVTMHLRLVHGRFFSDHDDEHAPPVVVIDDEFAREHFGGEDPIGKHIRTDDDGFDKPVEVIGVVAHTKQWGLDRDDTSPVRAQLYQPFWQLPDDAMAGAPDGIAVLVRARGDVAAAIATERELIPALGPEDVMFNVRTADEIIAGYQGARRFSMYVLVAFAALALLLSCIGVYGVLAYIVAQRTTEIGIRIALGARASDILRLVLRQGGRLLLLGLVLGLAGALAAGPYAGALVYGVSPTDPLTLAMVGLAVSLLALAAIVMPARRAMRMDPMQALRTD